MSHNVPPQRGAYQILDGTLPSFTVGQTFLASQWGRHSWLHSGADIPGFTVGQTFLSVQVVAGTFLSLQPWLCLGWGPSHRPSVPPSLRHSVLSTQHSALFPALRPCSQSSALRKAPHLLHGIPYNSAPTPVDAATSHSVTPARSCDAPSGVAGSVASRRTSVPAGERLQAQPEPAVTSADRRRVIPIHRKSLHSARQPSHHLPLRLPWQLATPNRQLFLPFPRSPHLRVTPSPRLPRPPPPPSLCPSVPSCLRAACLND